MREKGDDNMATHALKEHYTLNRKEAETILNAPVSKVVKPAYVKDMHLTPVERRKKAKDILHRWKNQS
ncbi:hypothetical protein [Shouchella miscanthi]|uniref:Integrase n=1 Tax=Shouchella miscanthi TaxID=2598861 RepID=A0ABU6NL38_9BACI|nr:hypothetical protein [Shouchella miscanthi]